MTDDRDVRFVPWDGRSAGSWTDAIDGADAIINFTGKNANCRLTEQNPNFEGTFNAVSPLPVSRGWLSF